MYPEILPPNHASLLTLTHGPSPVIVKLFDVIRDANYQRDRKNNASSIIIDASGQEGSTRVTRLGLGIMTIRIWLSSERIMGIRRKITKRDMGWMKFPRPHDCISLPLSWLRLICISKTLKYPPLPPASPPVSLFFSLLRVVFSSSIPPLLLSDSISPRAAKRPSLPYTEHGPASISSPSPWRPRTRA